VSSARKIHLISMASLPLTTQSGLFSKNRRAQSSASVRSEKVGAFLIGTKKLPCRFIISYITHLRTMLLSALLERKAEGPSISKQSILRAIGE
jgi:hypothetical protein